MNPVSHTLTLRPFPLLAACFLYSLLPAATMAQSQDSSPQKQNTASEEKTADTRPSPAAMFEPREFGDEHGNVLKYRLLKPVGYDPSEKYPLVIFLHGAGERGDDNVAQLKHGMSDFCDPDLRERFPCYVLAPQCPREQKWADIDWSKKELHVPAEISTPMSLVFEVVDQMLQDAALDKNRIYLTGLSMGGYGTWDCLHRRPNFFAAAIPICGGVSTDVAEQIKHVPVWCFHGGDDKVVPADYSRNIIASLRKAGGEPKYTEYEGVGHDSWSATYANPEIYDWLFSQRRTRPSK